MCAQTAFTRETAMRLWSKHKTTGPQDHRTTGPQDRTTSKKTRSHAWCNLWVLSIL